MKKSKKVYYLACPNMKRKKTWEVTEAKEKPGYAICPICGDYHKIDKKEQ